MVRVCENHGLEFLIEYSMQRLQNPRDGQEQEDYEENYLGCRVLKIHSVILHLGFPCICPRGSPARRAVSYTQMGTKVNDRSLL